MILHFKQERTSKEPYQVYDAISHVGTLSYNSGDHFWVYVPKYPQSICQKALEEIVAKLKELNNANNYAQY